MLVFKTNLTKSKFYKKGFSEVLYRECLAAAKCVDISEYTKRVDAIKEMDARPDVPEEVLEKMSMSNIAWGLHVLGEILVPTLFAPGMVEMMILNNASFRKRGRPLSVDEHSNLELSRELKDAVASIETRMFARIWYELERDNPGVRDLRQAMLSVISNGYSNKAAASISMALSGFPLFEIDSRLMGVFERLDIDNIHWKDVVLPFDAFAIKLGSGKEIAVSSLPLPENLAFLVWFEGGTLSAVLPPGETLGEIMAEMDEGHENHTTGQLDLYDHDFFSKVFRLVFNIALYIEACSNSDRRKDIVSVAGHPLPTSESAKVSGRPIVYRLNWDDGMYEEEEGKASTKGKAPMIHVVRRHKHNYRVGPRDNWHYEERVIGPFYRGTGDIEDILKQPQKYYLDL